MDLNNNYLKEIQFTAKFQSIMELTGENADPSDIEQIILDKFPKAYVFSENEAVCKSKNKTWVYQIRDIKNFKINHSSITLSLNAKYSDDLSEDVDLILNILNQLYVREDIVISLRYVNEITPRSVDNWDDWIDSELQNFKFQPSNSKLMRVMTRSEYEIDDFQLIFQYGQYNLHYPSTIIGNDYILDYECIRPDGCDIYDIKDDVARMNKIIFNVFKQSAQKMLMG